MNAELVKKVLQALEQERVKYVVFGGVALNLLGLARATEDLDIFVAPEADNIERLRTALHRVFDDPNIEDITTADLLGEYPAIQYIPPEGNFHIDILTRLGEAFRFEDLVARSVDFGGLAVTVVTPETLYAMKKGTIRPKDWGDAEALRRRFKLGKK